MEGEYISVILDIIAENESLKQQLAQYKYARTEKGYKKIQRNNEHRRIKTQHKKVLKELVVRCKELHR